MTGLNVVIVRLFDAIALGKDVQVCVFTYVVITGVVSTAEAQEVRVRGDMCGKGRCVEREAV